MRWIGDVFMEMTHWVGAWDFCRFVVAFGIMSWSIYRFAGGRVQELVEEE